MEKSIRLSRSKYQVRYTEAFKQRVCEEYLRSGCSQSSLLKKYEIGSHSSIRRWLQDLGYENQTFLEKPTPMNRDKPIDNEVSPSSLDSQEIRQLKKELEEKRLEAEKYARMIELAEKEFGISIRKK